VPVADEVGQLQRSQGPEGELFRRIAEQGHYAGRTQPTNTRQGIYALTADGDFLASVNTRRGEEVLAMLERALAAWNALAREEPDAVDAAEVAPERRFRSLYPADGLVLEVHSRDLPREDAPRDWRAGASNRDRAWFRRAEVRSMLPGELVPGAQRAWPDALAHRLARLHLVDNVRGQVRSFAADDVERAELETRVREVRGDRVEVELLGAVRLRAEGRWSVDGYRDMQSPAARERGLELTLLGRATYGGEPGRFIAFELVAAGERWGGTQYNARGDDLEPTPIGFVLQLAPDDAPVEPASFWEYGWR
jgi:hypothetical protein